MKLASNFVVAGLLMLMVAVVGFMAYASGYQVGSDIALAEQRRVAPR